MLILVAALAALYLWIKLGGTAAAANADGPTLDGGFAGTGGKIDTSNRLPTTLSDGSKGYIDELGAIWDSPTGGAQIGGISESPRPGDDSQLYEYESQAFDGSGDQQ
jgi:hypothetical protein